MSDWLTISDTGGTGNTTITITAASSSELYTRIKLITAETTIQHKTAEATIRQRGSANIVEPPEYITTYYYVEDTGTTSRPTEVQVCNGGVQPPYTQSPDLNKPYLVLFRVDGGDWHSARNDMQHVGGSYISNGKYKFTSVGWHMIEWQVGRYTSSDHYVIDTSIVPNGCFFKSEEEIVLFPDSIQELGPSCCQGDSDDIYTIHLSKLHYVYYPTGLTQVGSHAFFATSITDVIYRSGVTYGNRVYKNCTYLTGVTIQEGVTIVNNDFSKTGVKTLHIPQTVTSGLSDSFVDTYQLEYISVDSNNPVYDSRNNCNAIIESSTNILIRGASNTIVPNSVVGIDGNAFRKNALLREINLTYPDIFIGGDAFQGCTNLTGLTCNGMNAFKDGTGGMYQFAQTGLKVITCNYPELNMLDTTFQDVPTGGTLYYPDSAATAYAKWFERDLYRLGYYNWVPGNPPYFTAYYNVVDNTNPVQIIKGGAYQYRVDDGTWENLSSTSYTFSSTGIHKIDFRTDFYNQEDGYCVPLNVCNAISIWAGNDAGITELIVPGLYATIKGGAFSYLKELTAVTLNSGLVYIGNATFERDDALTEISFPDTLTALAPLAFYKCTNLSTIYSYATTAPTIEPAEYGYHAFRDISPTGILHYPSGSDYSTWLSTLGSGWTGVADL